MRSTEHFKVLSNHQTAVLHLPWSPAYFDNPVTAGLWCTGFVPFFRNKFPGLFQDSDWFFQDSKIHIHPFTPKILMLILLTICHTFHIFLLEFKRFPKLSRTSSPFPGLSSPGKCHNKIPGLSRFSRTRTNPVTRRQLRFSGIWFWLWTL